MDPNMQITSQHTQNTDTCEMPTNAHILTSSCHHTLLHPLLTYTIPYIEMQSNAHSLSSPTHNITEQHDTRNTLTSRDSPSPTPIPPKILSPLSSPSTDSLRRSPRKLPTSRSSQEKNDEVGDGKVRLLASSNLYTSRTDLHKATSAADKVNANKAAFTLTSKLLPSFFSLKILAQSTEDKKD